MLVSEQVLTLSDQVGVLANRAYAIAPELAADLHALAGDLRGLYEQVLEIEPSREDLRWAEHVLRDYIRMKRNAGGIVLMAQRVRRVERAIASLPRKMRCLLASRYWGCLSVADICERLSIPREEFAHALDDALVGFTEAYSATGTDSTWEGGQ